MAKSLSLDRAALPTIGPARQNCTTCGNNGWVECERCGEQCVCENLGQELCPDCEGTSAGDITDALIHLEDVRRETRAERQTAAREQAHG